MDILVVNGATCNRFPADQDIILSISFRWVEKRLRLPSLTQYFPGRFRPIVFFNLAGRRRGAGRRKVGRKKRRMRAKIRHRK